MNHQKPIDPEIKLEPHEDTWNDQEIKLEHLGIEKEELLDWPSTVKKAEDSSELLEPKLEESENHKTGRPSELLYPDYIKLESLEEPDNYSAKNLHSSSSTSTKPKPRRFKCSVCSGSVAYKRITQISSEDRRLVLMVGLVLIRKKTVDEAKLLMSLPKLIACRNHVAEAIHAIYEALKIKNIHELKTRSTENMTELMSTVKSIDYEWMPAARFEQLLMDMVWRTNPLNGNIEKPLQQSAFPSAVEKQRKCSLCNLLRNESCLIEINERLRRLVLLSEAVIRGKMSFESARFTYYKTIFRVCKSHLSDVVNSILKRLNIESIEEFGKCSSEDMRNLMAIAEKINRYFTVNKLYNVLIDFEKII